MDLLDREEIRVVFSWIWMEEQVDRIRWRQEAKLAQSTRAFVADAIAKCR